jgi:beta-glucosidase
MSSHTKPFLTAFAEVLGVTEPPHFEGPSKSCRYPNASLPYPDRCLSYGGNYDWDIPHQQLDQYYRTAIIFLGASSREGTDRSTLGFGTEAEEMVKRFGIQNKKDGKKTIVVMTVPGASTTVFRDYVDAILVQFYPGEMAAQSALDIIWGKANPSGKLPMTFPVGENDQNFTKSQYPGVKHSLISRFTYASYSEGLFMGYRWYDANDVSPAYPFGHGLSYTTFVYHA